MYKVNMIPRDLITQAKAAEIAGVTRQVIYERIQAGTLKSYGNAGVPLLSERDVLKYKPRKAGRPKKVSKEKS